MKGEPTWQEGLEQGKEAERAKKLAELEERRAVVLQKDGPEGLRKFDKETAEELDRKKLEGKKLLEEMQKEDPEVTANKKHATQELREGVPGDEMRVNKPASVFDPGKNSENEQPKNNNSKTHAEVVLAREAAAKAAAKDGGRS